MKGKKRGGHHKQMILQEGQPPKQVEPDRMDGVESAVSASSGLDSAAPSENGVAATDGEQRQVEAPLHIHFESGSVADGHSEKSQTVSTPSDMTSADYYFDSYSHFGIHEEMLKDTIRTRAYESAICHNRFLFEGKVVLDVGAGTGILSLFCAKAGAKHVYAVECSETAHMAKEIIQRSGFGDRVTLLHCKLEDVSLPVAKVDIIVSEWMGYFLLYEAMLDTVLFARDKWLAPDGLVMPDKTSLLMVGIEDEEYKNEKLHFWDYVYGFDMSCIRRQAMAEPLVDVVEPHQIVTSTCLLKTIEIDKIEQGIKSFSCPFKLVAQRNDFVHALVVYFDVSFSRCHKPISFSTGPRSRPTHWKQSVLYLDETLTMCGGESMTGTVSVGYNPKNHRDLDITVQYSLKGARCSVERTQHYKMR